MRFFGNRIMNCILYWRNPTNWGLINGYFDLQNPFQFLFENPFCIEFLSTLSKKSSPSKNVMFIRWYNAKLSLRKVRKSNHKFFPQQHEKIALFLPRCNLKARNLLKKFFKNRTKSRICTTYLVESTNRCKVEKI